MCDLTWITGIVIYHIPAKACEVRGKIFLPSLMEKLESVQYAAALAITRIWRGTSQEKIDTERGWESLSSRFCSRCLTLFYKMVYNLSPEYTRDPIPEPQLAHYSLRDRDVIGRIRARTEKFKSRVYPIA